MITTTVRPTAPTTSTTTGGARLRCLTYGAGDVCVSSPLSTLFLLLFLLLNVLLLDADAFYQHQEQQMRNRTQDAGERHKVVGWKGAVVRMGPNDVSGVVWAISKFFYFYFFVFFGANLYI